MSPASKKLISGVVLTFAIGAVIGWLYDGLIIGLLVASAVVVILLLRSIILFERAIRSDSMSEVGYGDGFWQQLLSQFKYERERGDRYKKQSRRLLKEIRRSIDAMPDGAVVIDSKHEIVTCNRAATGLIGLRRRKDCGQRLDNMFRDPMLTALLRDSESIRSAEIVSPLRDNEWLNCRIVPYGAGQKLVLIRDITERHTLNKIRRDFVANASHELRSPLTVISGYLEALADDERLPQDLVQPVTQMRAQALRITTIIKSLLELSRLEGDAQAPTDDAIDMGALISATAASLPVDDESPEINIRIESPKALLGNDREVESILRNLLSNAVRHTPADGQVDVTWRGDQDEAVLIVRDSGEGIATEHLPRLTERFFRVDRGRARNDGGFGLGLAIVKHALERHGGELIITSEAGKGSEFQCRFPPDRIVVT